MTIKRVPTIVAIGGGGFLVDDNWAMEEFLVHLTGKNRPKVCFLGQAGSDHPAEREAFYRAFGNLSTPTFTSHLDLCRNRPADIRGFLLSQDLIYVGGGDDVAMLAIWSAHNISAILHEAWRRGVILSGMSAGGDCWFADGITDAHGGLQPLGTGLGFLSGFCCPHSNEPGRKEAIERATITHPTMFADGIAIENNVAVIYEHGKMVECVSTSRDRKAWTVRRDSDGTRFLEIDTDYIGPDDTK